MERVSHPLAPLIEQWFTRPLPVARNKHSGPGIMVAPWQIDESAPRSGRLLRYFPQPTHLDTAKSGQILLPGFGDGRTEGMPSEFWELVEGSNSEVPSIAQRLAIFAPMQLNLADRKPGRAMSVTVPMSKFRDWAFPDTGAKRGRIRPREMLRGLEAASKQLDNYIINCLVDHGDGHIEYVRNLHPLRLGTLTEKWSRNGRNLQYEDSEFELIQTFPPGRVDTGPAVPTSLTYWGARNIRAWRLSLNLAYFNYDPGVTGARINKGQWVDYRDPDALPNCG